MPRKPWKQQSFGERVLTWLEYDFAERYEKSIQALVYFGAALLVIIVGLRGLGDISTLTYIPKFLLNQDGKIDSNFVMIGLLVEFTMLCLLAAVSFFSPKKEGDELQQSIYVLANSIEALSLGIQSEAGEGVIKTARESTAAIKDFLNKEIETVDKLKTQTEQQLSQMNDEIFKIRKDLFKEIAGSTNQINDFLQNEKSNLNSYFSSIENFINKNKDLLQSITNNLSSLAKNSTAETKGAFEREKDLINNFYNINSGLISQSGEEFREALSNFGSKIEDVVAEARTAFNSVAGSLKESVKSSTAGSNEVFEREKEMIEKFYKINSDLISKTNEEFRGILKNYNKILGEESEGLKRLSADRFTLNEQIQKTNKTNDKLITHLENIDKTLKTILMENGISNQAPPVKRRGRWQKFFNKTKS